MNKVVWAVQTNLQKDSSIQGLWLAAEEAGCEVLEVVLDKENDTIVDLEKFNEINNLSNTILIPYGSVMLNRLSNENGWSGNFFDSNTFDTQVWPKVRRDMLNEDSLHMPVKRIPQYLENIAEGFKWFIRPAQDTKSFAGSVIETVNIVDWAKEKSCLVPEFSPRLNGETMVSISPVKKIFSESRYFIVDGKIVDGSYYRFAESGMCSPVRQPETLDKAQELANLWLPSPCCVMDLADTLDGVKVIEFNTINSAGFYSHDIKKIVSALTNYAKNLPVQH